MTLPFPVRDLIPQKGKMGFDQILIKADPDDSESRTIISPGNIFLDDDHHLSNIVLIEYLNQLIAAVHGYNAKDTGKSMPKGLFVGVQEAKFMQTVNLGDSLTIKGFITEKISQVTFVQGVIEAGGEKVAELVTKLYEVEDGAALGALTNGGQILQPKAAAEIINNQSPVDLSSEMHRELYAYTRDLNIGEDFVSFKIACPKDFNAFDGHFPGEPILPGIILLEIAVLALKLWSGKPVRLKTIKRMKINGMVLPDRVISCTVKIDRPEGSPISFSALFKEGDERDISRFNGTFEEGIR